MRKETENMSKKKLKKQMKMNEKKIEPFFEANIEHVISVVCGISKLLDNLEKEK